MVDSAADRISEIIAETAPRHGMMYAAFKSDSPDGTVRPEDALDVYVVNNGELSNMTMGCRLPSKMKTIQDK